MSLSRVRELTEIKKFAALEDASLAQPEPGDEQLDRAGEGLAPGQMVPTISPAAPPRSVGFVVTPPEENLITVDLDIVQHGFVDYSGQFYLIAPRSLASPDARRMTLFLTLLQEHGFGRQVLWPNSRVIKKRLQQQKSCFASFDRFTVLKLRGGAWSQIFRALRDGDADFASLHYQGRSRLSRALQRAIG